MPTPPPDAACEAPPAAPLSFAPAELDWDVTKASLTSLGQRSLDTGEQAEAWLAEASSLLAEVWEAGSRIRIAHACRTNDEDAKAAFMRWIERVEPELKPVMFELKQRFVSSAGAEALAGRNDVRLNQLLRSWKAEVDLYRPENVAVQTEISKLTSEFDRIAGAMTVEFEGKTQTLPQLAAYQQETDRGLRERAWRAGNDRRRQDDAELDAIYDGLLAKRQTMAENAGLANYRDYAWLDRQRFDYSPAHCEAFHEAVEKVVVPALAELERSRQAKLGVETLRPWDGSVDPLGRDPLRPFAADDVEALRSRSSAALADVDPELGELFETLRPGRNLDLESRAHKRPGGFQSSLTKVGQPFIFMNAAGLQRDVDTMLHEAGHAFHFLLAHEREPLVFLQHAPIEFCEVASMSMELFGMNGYDRFYPGDAASADRARRHQLEGALSVLPWIALIDAFQHWVYTHPGHSSAERTAAWLELDARFATGVTDWAGLEGYRENWWRRQIHLFSYPFYYIEYGIAQLASLRLGLRYREEPAQTLASYKAALALADTKPLPELFEAAGAPFDFGPDAVGPVVGAVQAALAGLPE
ncbi:MAG: M3 family oligoendopeptidase [Planctomycetota bacterium]